MIVKHIMIALALLAAVSATPLGKSKVELSFGFVNAMLQVKSVSDRKLRPVVHNHARLMLVTAKRELMHEMVGRSVVVERSLGQYRRF